MQTSVANLGIADTIVRVGVGLHITGMLRLTVNTGADRSMAEVSTLPVYCFDKVDFVVELLVLRVEVVRKGWRVVLVVVATVDSMTATLSVLKSLVLALDAAVAAVARELQGCTECVVAVAAASALARVIAREGRALAFSSSLRGCGTCCPEKRCLHFLGTFSKILIEAGPILHDRREVPMLEEGHVQAQVKHMVQLLVHVHPAIQLRVAGEHQRMHKDTERQEQEGEERNTHEIFSPL
jgi:hypothetical protein